MDDRYPARQAEAALAPRLLETPDNELPPGFAPLRLRLQPGGLSVELTRASTLVGRHSDADVRLALPDVSRRHCRFVFADGGWQVIDLNSLNGVWINGERLQQSLLAQNDFVRIGSLTFLVDLGRETQPSPDEGDAVLRSISDILPGPGTEQRRAS
jgi:pSer/pThr/pTyr-binding forkhead associated (FHA) protein